MTSKTLKSIFSVLGILLLVSCVKSKETESTPYCAITSFGVNSIVSYVPYKTSTGTTTVKRTVSGSSIFFQINQETGLISTVKSLPNWINLTKVVPTFTCHGTLQYKSGDNYYTITSGKDSLDFTEPHILRCVSSDGLYSKSYLVSLTKNTEDSDTILWSSVVSNLELEDEKHRSIVLAAKYTDKNGADSLVRRIFIFSKNEAGKPQVTSTTDYSEATTWTDAEELIGAEGVIDPYSIMVHQNELYAIDNQGKLYKSTEVVKGTVWMKVSDKNLSRLLASDGYYLYAYDGTNIIATDDFTNWKECGKSNLEMLPTRCLYSFYRQSYNNTKVNIAMMGGLNDNNKNNGVTWYKVTDTQDDVIDPWQFIDVSNETNIGYPYLQETSTVMYGDNLYTMGRTFTEQFLGMYKSEDNGISWKLQTKMWRLPASLEAANGAASMVLIDKAFYVFQVGGKIWKGSIK